MTDTVTVIGTGNMGTALAERLGRAATVQRLARGDADRVEGEVVVLAVPYESLTGIVEQRGGQLDGRVVVDISNPVDFETFDGLHVAPDGSAAAELQTALPGARVVKAFNTNFAGTLAGGDVGGHPTTVLVAADDEAARTAVLELVRASGLQALPAGSLSRARELEGLGFLQIALANAEQIDWSAGFGVFR